MRFTPLERGSVHPSGIDRNPLPHALGDGACLLRAPRIGPRRGRGWISLSISWAGETGNHRRRCAGRGFDSDEGRRRREAARASSAGGIGADRQCHCRDSERIRRGGKLIIFGNGGSATDANDWAIDCVLPPAGLKPVPAVSLSLEPANITAIANDVGTEVIFLRQLIAQARPDDVAVAISTSGGSRNIIMALEEARKRKLLTVALLGYDGGEIHRRGLRTFR